MEPEDKLQDAADDLRLLLDRGYKKKSALRFVANRYLLKKRHRNFLSRSVFSASKSEDRKRKIVKMDKVKDKPLFVDGYNVLITVESICRDDEKSIVLGDDGVLRDTNAVFGKYKFNDNTEKAFKHIISLLKKNEPSNITFFFDRQVSFSGKLANLTQEIMSEYGLKGDVNLSKIVDFELVKAANDAEGIVATSDGVMIDKVQKIVDIPFYILDVR